MALYDINEIIDKDLYAKMKVNLREFPQWEGPGAGRIAYRANVGDRLGTVYSWVYGYDKNGKKNNDIWFLIEGPDGKRVYAKFSKGAFDVKKLREQGAMNVTEQKEAKDEESKAWYEKIADKIGKALPLIGLGIAAVYLGGKYIDKKVK